MSWFNPLEWFSWLYGKYFQNHFYIGALCVILVFAFVGLLLWIRGVDKYKDENPQQIGSQEGKGRPKPQAVTQNAVPKEILVTAKSKSVSHKKKKTVHPVALTQTVPAPSKTVGFIGGRQSLLRDSTVDGFDIAVDQSQSDTGIVDHSILNAPAHNSQQAQPTAPPGIDNAAKKDKQDSTTTKSSPSKPPVLDTRGWSHVIFDRSIFEGTVSAKDSDHVAVISSVLISDEEAHKAKMNNLNFQFMRKIREMRVHPSWIRGYLARVRFNFEGDWRTLPAAQQEQNEELFTEFEDLAESDTFDEQKCSALFSRIVEATPTTSPAPQVP
jgi:hypothetical protein